MADINEITDADFEQEILKSDIPAVVDFWAPWCAPCRQVAPIIEQLAEQYGDQVKVVKMNVDDSPASPGRYSVRAIPTVISFRGGEVVEQIQGLRPKKEFEEMIKKLL